jgi:mitochondrial import inner membrane translocase subunit TIM17
MGAGFAAWGGMFSVVDCSLAYVRQKEDPWNSIGSGFITGGLLQVRRMLFYSIIQFTNK